MSEMRGYFWIESAKTYLLQISKGSCHLRLLGRVWYVVVTQNRVSLVSLVLWGRISCRIKIVLDRGRRISL